jgi:hypothetical protein
VVEVEVEEVVKEVEVAAEDQEAHQQHRCFNQMPWSQYPQQQT